ncbi:TPA: hypothetical protein ACGUW2_004497 [Vibrio vulnificus]
MHPLRNGSQVTERPDTKPLIGSPGWFTESGENNVPSYPGADWFNHVIAEFMNALNEMGVAFNPQNEDHLQKAFKYIKDIKDNYRINFENDSHGSAVENMIAGRIDGLVNVTHALGNRYCTGATNWLVNSSKGVDLGDGLFAQSETPRDAQDYALNRADTQGLIDIQDGSGQVQYTGYGSLHMANGPDNTSIFDFANFAGQNQGSRRPIGFVFHHYTDGIMTQMDNVGTDNKLLFLKNANNPLRRPDKPADFIGSAKFISLGRNESDGAGGVTETREGFFISKDFELVWPQQTTGTATARIWNNIAAGSQFWSHEFKNSHEQKYLFRIDNGGTTPISAKWNAIADATQVEAHKSLQLKAVDGILYLDASKSIRIGAPVRLHAYATGTLPALEAGDVGVMAYINEGTNKFPVHWDGSAWRKVSDNTPV